MYRLCIRKYAGGEVRLTTSLFSVKSPASDIDEHSESEKTPPAPLLDYNSQVETARRVRLSGFGEFALRPTRFGKRGKDSIQRCARALDEEVSRPGDILFLTGTLPGTGNDQYAAIASYSSYIVHRLKAWVAKRVPSKYDFYCWELQKRGALHIHYAVHCPDPSAAEYILSEFHTQWCRLLDYVSQQTGVDLYLNNDKGFSHAKDKSKVQAKAERVEKGVGNYLGKYLSKSSAGIASGRHFAPCRWWGVSRPLRSLEKSKRQELHLIFMSKRPWLSCAEDMAHWLHQIGVVCHDWNNKFVPGIGAVAYGVLESTLDTIVKMVTGKNMAEKSVLDLVNQEWQRLKEVMIHIEMNQPMWFGSLVRRTVCLRRWEEIQRMGKAEITTPQGLSLLQSIVYFVRETVTRNEIINVERLKHCWKASLLCTLNETQKAMDKLYAEEYKLQSAEDFYTNHLGVKK